MHKSRIPYLINKKDYKVEKAILYRRSKAFVAKVNEGKVKL